MGLVAYVTSCLAGLFLQIIKTFQPEKDSHCLFPVAEGCFSRDIFLESGSRILQINHVQKIISELLNQTWSPLETFYEVNTLPLS